MITKFFQDMHALALLMTFLCTLCMCIFCLNVSACLLHADISSAQSGIGRNILCKRATGFLMMEFSFHLFEVFLVSLLMAVFVTNARDF